MGEFGGMESSLAKGGKPARCIEISIKTDSEAGFVGALISAGPGCGNLNVRTVSFRSNIKMVWSARAEVSLRSGVSGLRIGICVFVRVELTISKVC